MTREIVASKKQDWATPLDFFNAIHEEFQFTLDVCAAWYNLKHPCYLGPGSPFSEDGLSHPWAGERCFCNPPYEDIGKWLEKGLSETQNGAFSVFLVPANTDTKWFHRFATVGEVQFIKGRLSFEDLTPPELELERVYALHQKKPAQNLLKQMALLVNELAPFASDLRSELFNKSRFPMNEKMLARADTLELTYRACASGLKEDWPTAKRKAGPGFPSILVIFDPNAPAGVKPFRTRDAKTGLLLS